MTQTSKSLKCFKIVMNLGLFHLDILPTQSVYGNTFLSAVPLKINMKTFLIAAQPFIFCVMFCRL
jgi:hypothetical protein